MNFLIKQQDNYSRGQLLLRTFFGFFYILLPHLFTSLFYSIGFLFSRIATFWTVLFTQKFPKKYFDFQSKVLYYNLRLGSSLFDLRDEYPSFSLDAKNDAIIYEPDYRENVDFGTLIVRTLFAGIMLIPHIFVLVFRIYGVFFVHFIAWWAILFTGKFPTGMFNFIEGTLRWSSRLSI